MREKKRQAILREFSLRILEPLIEELKEIQAELAGVTSDEFISGTTHLLDAAVEGFLDVAGVKNFDDIKDDALGARGIGYIISGLNSALPLDHPYIIAYLVTKDTGIGRFIATSRSKLSGRHDILSQNILPVFEADSVEAALRDELRLQRIITPEHEREENPES